MSTQDKRSNLTDPYCGHSDGDQNIRHVTFAASQVASLRGGKAVDLHHRYQIATANSSNLAGWLAIDAIGVTGGHPATVADNEILPVDFGQNVSYIMPTSNRVAVDSDVGKVFDIVVSNNVQCINMTSSSKAVLTVAEVIDVAGNFVAARIVEGKKYGNLA